MLYLYIGLFGFLGAVARFVLANLFAGWSYFFPLGTLIINMAGCFIMGFVFTLTIERLTISSDLRMGITTGFIGSLTTFSAFCWETVDLIITGRVVYALLYVLISTLGGLAVLRLGINLVRITGRIHQNRTRFSETGTGDDSF